MKINWIEFENLDTGLKITKTEFNQHICLLVGQSGAGKSQILSAIMQLCNIANGNKITNTIKGSISFNIDCYEYIWSVETSESDKSDIDFFDSFEDLNEHNYNKIIISESLLTTKRINDLTDYLPYYMIFKLNTNNDKNNVYISGFESIPTTSRSESLIFQFRNDDLLKNVYINLKHIILTDYSIQIINFINSFRYNNIIKKYTNLNSKLSNEINRFPAFMKFGIHQNYSSDVLNKIKQSYIRIFNEISDIKFEPSQKIETAHCIKMKIREQWVEQQNISSGMLKTLACLIDLYTLTDDYVVIIDEIENSLGVNCLDEVCEAIQYERDDLQFIITSHHPYIINQIDINSWQIVKRHDNVISTTTAESEGLLESYHEAYDKLQKLLKYGDT